jgi:pimeloyl-ACP methyl ester carboxylesterase
MKTFTHFLPGITLTGHEFQVPLDHSESNGPHITIFAREMVATGKEAADLPWLVFFQGGPGFGAPRPDAPPGVWYRRAVQDYRVLLLDQRGTGLSTPVTFQTLASLPTPQAQADYLKHFRADNIVRDAESIRCELLGADVPWSALGQSYGGFCLVTYLSLAPAGLKEAMITGGLPSLVRPVDDVYRATYRRVAEQNRRYYARYPDDVDRVRAIVDVLASHEVVLPDGGRLTPRRFQALGMAFGASDGFEKVHYLLEEAFVRGPSGRELGYGFLRGVAAAHAFDTNPIYALLHEACYCQGEASNWSAERVRAEFSEFGLDSGGPIYFTGEMIYPWMFDDYAGLRPLRDAGQILAGYADWPPLYDVATLQANHVPVAAAVYYEDMYVERAFSDETAATIAGSKRWVTNEYAHNGLRADGERILDRLIGMVRGQI